jgi:hypothetical protein
MDRNFVVLVTGMLIAFGALNTIMFKVQNTQVVYEGAYVKYFFHPYIQTCTMFIGEALMLPVFLLLRRANQEAYRTKEL